MITPAYKDLSIREQCEILDIGRSTLYYKQIPQADESILANEIHEIWNEWPAYGYRRITKELQKRDYVINHKKVLHMMQDMNIQALYPRPKTTTNANHKIYPYLLKGLKIVHPNQVWATDITYIKMHDGFMYLVALIDWYSRFIIDWNFSNTLETRFCIEMLTRALEANNKPQILNTDQGCQYTSNVWTDLVEENGIKVSMDGAGRWIDNVIIERFWRTLKHEHVLLHEFESVGQARDSIGSFIKRYNYKRLHQSLNYRPPADLYFLSKTGGQIGS